MNKHLKFHFPAKLKTYIGLFLASVMTILTITLFLKISHFSQVFFKYIIIKYPVYGLLTPITFAIIIYLVKYKCHFVGGSGIPQTLAALNSYNKSIRSSLLSFRIAISKIFFIFIAMLFGAPIGIEGPSIHIGSSIFYNFQAFIKLKRKLLIHALITIGGSIGLLIAFNSPLAALSFAYEEIGKNLKKQAIFLIFITVTITYIMLVFLRGNIAYLGNFTIDFNILLTWQLIPVAITCGLLGGIFSKVTLIIINKLKSDKKSKIIIIAFTLGLIVAIFNYLSDGLTAGSGHQETINLLNANNLGFNFVYMKFLATLSSLVSLIPGGIFMPSISIGAGIGSLFGEFLTIDYITILIMAMIAYLSAVIRAPITSSLVILEMTTAMNLIIPALIIALIGNYISSKIQKETLFTELAKNFNKTIL